MIAPGQHGKNLRDIPEQCFDYGFDREDRWPGLVLASTVTVPNGNTDGWRLATQSCGGFSCNEFQAAVLPLPVRPEMLRFLETVAEEEFSPAPLDYFNMMDAADAAAVKKGYPSFGFAENTDDLFVGKTLLHGDVLMWLMKTLLTSGCTNQRGAGHSMARNRIVAP